MNDVDVGIQKIDVWLKQSKIAESRLGLMACANARAVERVRNGSASVETLRQLLEYIRKNPTNGS